MIKLKLKPKEIEVLFDVLDWYKRDLTRTKGVKEMDDEDWVYFHTVELIQDRIVYLENVNE